jgi:hypothetical protein
MEAMAGCVKALPVLVHASVGSMADLQSGDHRENREPPPNELTFPPKNCMRPG